MKYSPSRARWIIPRSLSTDILQISSYIPKLILPITEATTIQPPRINWSATSIVVQDLPKAHRNSEKMYRKLSAHQHELLDLLKSGSNVYFTGKYRPI